MVAGDSDSSRFLHLERGRGGFMEVGEWLRNLGLGKYEPEFIENAIDLDVLPELTEDDLEKLGMPLGDRKRFKERSRRRLQPVYQSRAKSGRRRANSPR